MTWNLYAAAGWPNPTHDALENKNMLSQSAGTVISNTDEISAFIDNLYYAEFIRYKNYGLWGQQSYYPELTCSWLDSDDNNFWYTNPCEGEPIYETGEWLVMNLTSYDIYGNLLEVKDYEGNPSWIRYDELGIHPVKGWSSEIGSESNPAWQAGYDTAGNIINMTDANGQTTYYAYDEFNRLENVQLSGESEPTTSHEYYLAADSFSLENPNYVRSYQKLEDGKIFTTTTYLDGLSKNLQTGITESPSSEIKTNILYNAAGFVSAKSKPYKDEGSRAASYAPLRDGVLTSEITYKPNPLKRMDKAYPISSEPDVYVQAFYEAKDLELNDCSSQEDCYTTLISVDEEGKQTIKQLDKLGNTVQVIDASNNKSIYEYDFLSNLKNVTNANSLVTLYEYDRLGRITNSTNPNTGTTKLTYDGNGNIKTRNDSEGNLVTFSYDGLGRPTRSDYPDSSYIEYVYDEPRDYGIGRLTKVTSTLNGFLTIKTYHYDEKGRIVKTITTLNGEDHVIEYEYDLAGNLVYEKLSDGTEIEYIYNNMNQLQNIKVNGVEKISYVYDALNNPLLVQNIDYPNSQTVFTYDDRDRVDTLSIEGAEDYFSRLYQYDNTGNLVDEYSDLFASPDTQIGHYVYDNTYQLAGLVDFNNYYGGNIDYDYDTTGNILSRNDVEYSYALGNDQMISDGTYEYEYDARGNMITKILIGTESTTQYIYDYENRLSTVVLPDGSAINYYYDADGRLAKKIDWEGTTIYIYDMKGNLVYEKFIGPQ